MTKQIETVLVANRGEIAVRVMRTAKEMGLRTVAVYSEADVNAMHVREAHTAMPLGGQRAEQSYLNIGGILRAAKHSGADAIHPGYGFLSENTAFVVACEEAGLIFIGPPSRAVRIMGDKARAKKEMLKTQVPCIPGYEGEEQSNDILCSKAEDIGMPVMIKAAAGGGGRGMRRVDVVEQLPQAIELARSEAERAFGKSDLIIERALEGARHVEVQIFADMQGNVIHLGERDCSLQRRHQKVLEESPCPVMTYKLRDAMGCSAVEAARAVDYVGAGTVEFLLDKEENFFFLEMNTRLQVEHPVTEAVTGFDLVEWQIRIAQGEPLPAKQQEVELFGNAIEVRLCAEDPGAAFLPSSGSVSLFNVPQGEGVRVDTGIQTGDVVSPFYDSMVAKIIVWGETRDAARLRLYSALRTTALIGVAHNREFLMALLTDSAFVTGAVTTDFVDDCYPAGYTSHPLTSVEMAAGIVLQQISASEYYFSNALSVSSELRGWVSTGSISMGFHFEAEGESFTATVITHSDEKYEIHLADAIHTIVLEQFGSGSATLTIDGERDVYFFYILNPSVIEISHNRRDYALTNLDFIPPDTHDPQQEGSVRAPMHGQLISLLVEVGHEVECNQRLAVFEAMKMQHEILAPVAGLVLELNSEVGQQVAAGDVLILIEEKSSG